MRTTQKATAQHWVIPHFSPMYIDIYVYIHVYIFILYIQELKNLKETVPSASMDELQNELKDQKAVTERKKIV